ncbi:MAG: 2,3-bisphosphoglycerate-independent phosphoglycerate mutase [Saprospiraceae bacterium]|nr:2,3-bisphosphoglycerate-independent phosphoglycerate mutase [Saprospiraceae bacterium]
MKKALLAILDGWGHGNKRKADAIALAHTPFMNSLYTQYPNSELITFGEDVGLPEGQMGNSEVGHMNIGAGRVVYQELARINKAIRERTFHHHPVLLDAFAYAKKHKKNIHLVGLVSDGGVHSHSNHLKALCDIATEQAADAVYIHAFTDGRDTNPQGGITYLRDIQTHISDKLNIKIASICGRYYAMDRDKRWERVRLAYDLLVHGKGEAVTEKEVINTLQRNYDNGITDEFLKPIVVTENGLPIGTIHADDVVISFNFRTDRPRQIITVLTQTDMPEWDMHPLPLYCVTMTEYDESFRNIHVVYTKDNVTNTLGEVLEQQQQTQLRVAETEKYPHVTFFFSGGREEPFIGEHRLLVPSPKVATYDLQPEMSAEGITAVAIDYIHQQQPNFVCLNYANTDMVGHTGVFAAAQRAAETVDACLKCLVECALSFDYEILIIADHGNSDFMINEDGSPNTAHTINPVPCIYVSNHPVRDTIKNGRLADIAPTILYLMQLPQPPEMDGQCLFAK